VLEPIVRVRCRAMHMVRIGEEFLGSVCRTWVSPWSGHVEGQCALLVVGSVVHWVGVLSRWYGGRLAHVDTCVFEIHDGS